MWKVLVVMCLTAAVSCDMFDQLLGDPWYPQAVYFNKRPNICIENKFKPTIIERCACEDGKDAAQLEVITRVVSGYSQEVLDSGSPTFFTFEPFLVVDSPEEMPMAANVTCDCGGVKSQRVVVAFLDPDHSLMGHTNRVPEDPPYTVFLQSKKILAYRDLKKLAKRSVYLKKGKGNGMCTAQGAADSELII